MLNILNIELGSSSYLHHQNFLPCLITINNKVQKPIIKPFALCSSCRCCYMIVVDIRWSVIIVALIMLVKITVTDNLYHVKNSSW